jgi:undecaprenyl pyrophosphate phosphatase UppP
VANYSSSRPDIANSKLASSIGGSISWFRSLDPVVIGLGFSHEQQSKEVQINNLRYRQSDTNSLSATMAFAINDQMSLSLTSAASRSGNTTSANINVPRQTAVSTSFSFGYAPTKQDSFFVSSVVASTGGSTSMGLGLTYSKRFF